MVLDLCSLQGAGIDLPVDAPPPLYELSSILVHKGTSAFHGHYVAHVRDFETGTWWRVDDEETSVLQHGPSSGTTDHGTQGGEKSDKAADKAAAKAEVLCDTYPPTHLYVHVSIP